MNKSVIAKYRMLSLLSGLIMGCVFPFFARIFMTAKSPAFEIGFSISCVFAGLAVGFISYSIGKMTILKTVLRLRTSFERMSSGDFTHQCTIESHDSVGELVDYLSMMQVSLKELIGVVRNKSLEIHQSVDDSRNLFQDLGHEIAEVHALAGRILSEMQDVSANSIMLSETASEIDSVAKAIANKAEGGVQISSAIAENAGKAKAELAHSISQATEIMNTTSKRLETAIDNIRVVDEIKVLLNTIMNVSSQTNMLALNASIEASRAGNHGAGFAVIAMEIRSLSEESRHNTEQITQVVSRVTSAVDDLTECSKDLLDFLSENVRNDYDRFRSVVEEYEENSTQVESIVVEFSAASQELFASLQEVTERINEISCHTQTSAESVNQIFSAVDNVNSESQVLAEGTAQLEENAQKLEKLVQEFRLE